MPQTFNGGTRSFWMLLTEDFLRVGGWEGEMGNVRVCPYSNTHGYGCVCVCVSVHFHVGVCVCVHVHVHVFGGQMSLLGVLQEPSSLLFPLIY